MRILFEDLVMRILLGGVSCYEDLVMKDLVYEDLVRRILFERILLGGSCLRILF